MGIQRPPARSLLAAALLALLVAGVCWTFLPGNFIPDTYDICDQGFSGRYTDWHTPLLAWMWGTTRLPAEVLFVATTASIIVSVYWLLRPLLRRRWAMVATYVTVLNPLTLGILSFVLKDTWMVAGLFGAMALLLFAERPDVGRGWRRWAVAAAAVSLWFGVATRNTAAVPALAVVFCLWPWPARGMAVGERLGDRARSAVRFGVRLGASVLVVLVMVASQAAITRVVVQPKRVYIEQGLYGADLAALSLRTGEMLLPHRALAPGADLDRIREVYDPARADQLYFMDDAPLRYMRNDAAEADLRRRWADAIAAHPFDYLRIKARFSSSLLGFGSGVFGTYGPTHSAAYFHLTCPLHARYAPSLFHPVDDVLSDLASRGLVHPWLALVVLVAAWVWAGRRDRLLSTLLAVGLASVVPFLFLANSATYRYMWPMVLCAQVALWAAVGSRVEALQRADSPLD